MSLIYLATPIDFANNDSRALQFRSEIAHHLTEAGYTIYDPSRAWNVNGPMTESLARAIEGVNRQALRRSDVVVAWLPEGVQTQGVPAEIEFATRHQGIPAIVLGTIGVALTANPMVDAMAEADVAKLPRQVELALIGGRMSDYFIRYSSTEEADLRLAHPTDAGIDLPCAETIVIPPGSSWNVSTGIKLELPSGSFGWIVARSSAYPNYGLIVLPGVIDQGYQGELKVNCLNLGSRAVRVESGSRIGQLLIMHNALAGYDLRRVDSDQVHPFKTPRGDAGFGSSGV